MQKMTEKLSWPMIPADGWECKQYWVHDLNEMIWWTQPQIDQYMLVLQLNKRPSYMISVDRGVTGGGARGDPPPLCVCIKEKDYDKWKTFGWICETCAKGSRKKSYFLNGLTPPPPDLNGSRISFFFFF